MLPLDKVSKVRKFNRSYTELLGLLNKKVFDTNISWQEGRILLEIKLNHLINPKEIATTLRIDKSYTSRIINRLTKQGFLQKIPSPTDSRSVQLKLTSSGEAMANDLDRKSDDQVEQLVANLSTEQQAQFYQAVETINQLLFPGK